MAEDKKIKSATEEQKTNAFFFLRQGLCHLWLTAASASFAQAIFPPKPPEWLGLQAGTTTIV